MLAFHYGSVAATCVNGRRGSVLLAQLERDSLRPRTYIYGLRITSN